MADRILAMETRHRHICNSWGVMLRVLRRKQTKQSKEAPLISETWIGSGNMDDLISSLLENASLKHPSITYSTIAADIHV